MEHLKYVVIGLTFLFAINGVVGQEEKRSLQHVLLFDWKADADADKKEAVLDLFRGLVDKVVGFESLAIETITKSSGDFDIVLLLEFHSEEALEAYKVHADHITISEIAPPLLNSYTSFDFYGDFN